MKPKRHLKYAKNIEELQTLRASLGLEVPEFSKIHLRIVGKQSVDYWPSTGRAWITGSRQGSRLMPIFAACEAALADPAETLPEGAQAHMNSI